jgi:predicted NBD/HSP70 family sugar kinase
VLRRINLQAVFRVLHAGGAHTVTELARASKLSRPTTKQAVDDLLRVGLIRPFEVDIRPANAVGRPAQKYRFRPEAGFVLGVDIGAHKAIAIVADLDGNQIARTRITLDPTWRADKRLAALDDVISQTLAQRPADALPVSRAVVATPGVVDLRGVIAFCEVIPGWVGQRLGKHIFDRFGIPAESVNDIRMAALAEMWKGISQNETDVVYLHAGRRLGTALVLGGRPFFGTHGAATEIGLWRDLHWKTAYSDFLQVPHDAQMPNGESVTKVFAAAAGGDAAAEQRVNTLAAELSRGLAPIIVAVDPALVVIGGGMSAAGEAIARPLRARISAETPFPPRVECSTLGDESVALGAIRLALDAEESAVLAELVSPRS